ncbi:CDGSH iron-sulfur domain-containing protein [Saccharomonospora xinjiangensis]|uniref:Iron-binding zinc finger protein, CDGSH type n=1 Tax=Saccharomonospora xinjiangensis XJ-54 TaxID=882086 RepID=I0UYY0_9PSEU|nr:CDGSH iron-sulfur domain-containing protein [Saccharomonospora xinjiangensis]EID53083.1 iron-binding zinc finger protein, CDGSH type [Saccharomonospora xinjiangensis XJ-54]
MPTESQTPRERSPRRDSQPRRVTVVPGGPVLIEGPVELCLDDGTTVVSDRFQVAVCACRRSRTYPFCDASHRRKRR